MLLTPIKFAFCYFVSVLIRSIFVGIAMCCVSQPGVIHHYARNVFTTIDFFVVPGLAACALFLSNYEGMDKECVEIKHLTPLQLQDGKYLADCPKWTWENEKCRKLTMTFVDHVIDLNFYGIGIYALCLWMVVICVCCVMLAHHSEAQSEINAKTTDMNNKTFEEMEMGPGKGAMPIHGKNQVAQAQPTYLERV